MRTAIVGCGQIADAHIQQTRRIVGARIEAVCDLNYHMAEQAAARFQVPGLYTDLERMLDEVKPDVVHITTPPMSHLGIARKVLAAGAHAYIEKPFTMNAAEAEELVDCANRAGRLLCVGHSYAFDRAFLRLNEAVVAGHLGDVVHVDTVMGYNLAGAFGSVFMADPTHWVHQLPGGPVHNNLSHPLSLLLPFLPDPRPAVLAQGLRWRKQRFNDVRDRFFDEVRVLLIGEQTTASVVFTCRARPLQLYVTVHGTRRQATASIDGRTLHVANGAELPGPFARLQWAYRDHRETAREVWRHAVSFARADLEFFQGMHELIQRFYFAIEGKGAMPVPEGEALRVSRLLDAILAQCHKNERDRQ